MLACHCLNVIIEPEINDVQKVSCDTLELTEFEKKDTFFNQEIHQIEKLSKIVKKISALVITRVVGSRWLVHHCINCNIHTHAIHRDRGAAFVLVSSKLLNNEAIAEIKSSEQYSPVFDIKIMKPCSNESKKSYDILPSDSDAIINSLRQRVNEYINRETVAVEDRIKKYTEDQYKALNDYKDRVCKEHYMLKMKILEYKLDVSTENENEINTSITNSSQVNSRSPLRTVPDIMSSNSPLVINSTPTNPVPVSKLSDSNVFGSHRHSFDAEVLFPLEGMDDEPTLEQSDFEESDQEDFTKHDNPEVVQQRQRQSTQLAKSLPVNIPIFMAAYQNHHSEDNDDELPDESMDIAASMKALAKSIQGSTVFGELPRPRFSSQI